MSKDLNLKISSINRARMLECEHTITGRKNRINYGRNSCNGLEVRADDLCVHSDSKNMSYGLFFSSSLNSDIYVKTTTTATITAP